MTLRHSSLFFFFFNDTATTEIYTLSLHDALPICGEGSTVPGGRWNVAANYALAAGHRAKAIHDGSFVWADYGPDRKSTRLNSSHLVISYAVFCLKTKNLTRAPHDNYPFTLSTLRR